MASVIGKWKIESVENFEEFMVATGVSEAKRSDAHKYLSTGSNMTQEFSCNGDDWVMTTTTESAQRDTKFTIGKEFESLTLDGRPIKVVFTIDGDKLVEKQTGDGFECTHVREGSGDCLTMTLTGNGAKCIRKFSRA